MIIARAPYRICLGGGGTDRPEFYKKHDGFCVSMAINKYIYVTLKPDVLEKQIKLRYSKTEIVDNVSDLQHDRAKEVLSLYGLTNAIEINSCGDIPAKTGLGSSGSYLVALLNLVRHYKKYDCSPRALAEQASIIEMDRLNLPVGKQDQYISAFGGLRAFDFHSSDRDGFGSVTENEVEIGRGETLDFIKNLHVYYLGMQRDASCILKDQTCDSPEKENIMLKVKEMGYEVVDILRSGNYDNFGFLMDRYWEMKKKLANGMSNSRIDTLYDLAKTRFKVLGGKVIGAGGGGFIMFYVNKNHQGLQEFMEKSGHKRLHFLPDYKGSTILGDFS